MPSPDNGPSPEDFRTGKGGVSTVAWIAGLLLAALGVMFAVVDVSDGTATGSAADSSFAPTEQPQEPDLVNPRGHPAATAKAAAAPTFDPLARAAEQAAREREADVLIEQLKQKLRAEREARTAERKNRR